MKIRDGFVLRQVAGQWMVVPTGAAVVDFGSMITLNDSAACMWKVLQAEVPFPAVAAALCDAFEVEPGRADADAAAFVGELRENGLLLGE